MKSKKNSLVVPDNQPAVPRYRGRFAPSPTGPLHLGSLTAALASYLDARANNGVWLVRIEDLDPPREMPGATRMILGALEKLGLYWDEDVVLQSQRHEAYAEALQTLAGQNYIYACVCTRHQVTAHQGYYSGTCRDLQLPAVAGSALRCRIQDLDLHFTDRLQGEVHQHLATQCGDFVIKRKDGLFAYQLAVVVDDAWQGITDVVRGIDLLDSTPRQIYLQWLLQLPAIRYAHTPVVVDNTGQKLSKQQHAAPLALQNPAGTLIKGLTCLLQSPPQELTLATVEEILDWGVRNWQPEKLRGIAQISQFEDQTGATV